MRIAVVGDLLLDLYFDGQELRPSPEIPGSSIVRSDDLRANLGGAGVVASICAVRHETALFAPVGGWPAQPLRSAAERSQVALVAIPWGGANPVKLRMAHQGMYCGRVDVEPAQPVPCDLTAVGAVLVADFCPDVVILSDYNKGCFTGPNVADIEALVYCGLPVVVDCKPPNAKRFRGATAVAPNQREAAAITKQEYPTAKELRRRLACDLAVITRGKDGAAYATSDQDGEVPGALGGPWIVGAGDAFTAHLAEALGSGMKAAEAVAYANAEAAAYTCRPQGHSELL